MSPQSSSWNEITREELYDHISDILKERIGNKQVLLQLIEERLSLSIPKSYTYRKIVEKIVSEERKRVL